MEDCQHERIVRPGGTEMLICVDCGKKWTSFNQTVYYTNQALAPIQRALGQRCD